MAESSWLRGLGVGPRSRTPSIVTPPPLSDDYDGAYDRHYHRHHHSLQMQQLSPHRLRPRGLTHKASSLSLISLRTIATGKSTRTPSPESDRRRQDEAWEERRKELEGTWHQPNQTQLLEDLQVAMMTKPDAMKPLPPHYNTHVLQLLEGYAQLKKQLQEKEAEVVALQDLRVKELEQFQGMSGDWMKQAEDYKAEIKRLELVLAHESKDGLASLALARSGTLVNRSGTKKLQARLLNMGSKSKSSSKDSSSSDATEMPHDETVFERADPPGIIRRKTIREVLDLDKDIKISGEVKHAEARQDARHAKSRKRREAKAHSHLHQRQDQDAPEARDAAQQQTIYIPTGASSSGRNRESLVTRQPSLHHPVTGLPYDSSSSSCSTVSTEDGLEMRHRGKVFTQEHVEPPESQPLGDDIARGQDATPVSQADRGKSSGHATFVGVTTARDWNLEKGHSASQQTSQLTSSQPVSLTGLENSRYPTPSAFRSTGGPADETHPESTFTFPPVNEAPEAAAARLRNRRVRGFSFMAGDDVLLISPPANTVTFRDRHDSAPSSAPLLMPSSIDSIPMPAVRATEPNLAPSQKSTPPAGHDGSATAETTGTPQNLDSDVPAASPRVPAYMFTSDSPPQSPLLGSETEADPGRRPMPLSESTGSVIYLGRKSSNAGIPTHGQTSQKDPSSNHSSTRSHKTTSTRTTVIRHGSDRSDRESQNDSVVSSIASSPLGHDRGRPGERAVGSSGLFSPPAARTIRVVGDIAGSPGSSESRDTVVIGASQSNSTHWRYPSPGTGRGSECSRELRNDAPRANATSSLFTQTFISSPAGPTARSPGSVTSSDSSNAARIAAARALAGRPQKRSEEPGNGPSPRGSGGA